MSEELIGKCSASDCASCGGCESNVRPGEDHNTITLTLDDDSEIECAILTVFPVEKKEYIALLPLDKSGQNQDGEVYLYQFSRTTEGDPILANIEDDDEYAAAAGEFEKILENARKAEMAGEPLE